MTPATMRPGVVYRRVLGPCSGTRSELLEQEVLLDTGVAHQRLRRAAIGLSQAVIRSVAVELTVWLEDRAVLPTLTKALDAGQGYELELCGPGVHTVLSAHRVTLLPLLSRRSSSCPALLLHGRRTWAMARDRAE
ncbi:hypothetical protein ACIA8O_11990 [Kitasatospora sp. NPDC051853]|uniref:hypothetical protein n=1 Tax=Kitasatospora sp. NPDC051853 TaxID=3364058 RepID=UPI00379C3D36